MKGKVKKDSVPIGILLCVKCFNKCLKCSFSAQTPAQIRFATRFCSPYNTLFEISHEIRRSGASITTVVMETTQLVLSQFKNFSVSQLRIE